MSPAALAGVSAQQVHMAEGRVSNASTTQDINSAENGMRTCHSRREHAGTDIASVRWFMATAAPCKTTGLLLFCRWQMCISKTATTPHTEWGLKLVRGRCRSLQCQ